jgi:hypothetical protein
VPVIGSLPLAVVVLVVVITGAAGGVASTVMVMALDTGDTLPAASLAVAVMVCAPSASAVDGVNVHAPLEVAVAVPKAVVPS